MNVITKLAILQNLFLNCYQVVSTQAVLFLADSLSLLRGLYKDQKFRTISVNASKDIKLSQKYSLYIKSINTFPVLFLRLLQFLVKSVLTVHNITH